LNSGQTDVKHSKATSSEQLGKHPMRSKSVISSDDDEGILKSSGTEVLVIKGPQSMWGSRESDYWKERNANIAWNKAQQAELQESFRKVFMDIQAGGSTSKLGKRRNGQRGTRMTRSLTLL